MYFKIGIETFYDETRCKIKSDNESFTFDCEDSNLVYSMILFSREQISYYKNSMSKKYFKYTLNFFYFYFFENILFYSTHIYYMGLLSNM